MDTKMIADFVGSVGVPGAILLILVWSGKQLVPSLVKFLEGLTQSLSRIESTVTETKEEVKEINNRLSPAR